MQQPAQSSIQMVFLHSIKVAGDMLVYESEVASHHQALYAPEHLECSLDFSFSLPFLSFPASVSLLCWCGTGAGVCSPVVLLCSQGHWPLVSVLSHAHVLGWEAPCTRVFCRVIFSAGGTPGGSTPGLMLARWGTWSHRDAPLIHQHLELDCVLLFIIDQISFAHITWGSLAGWVHVCMWRLGLHLSPLHYLVPWAFQKQCPGFQLGVMPRVRVRSNAQGSSQE